MIMQRTFFSGRLYARRLEDRGIDIFQVSLTAFVLYTY